MKGIIYRAYCLVTEKNYIGLSIQGLKKRKEQHLYDAFNDRADTHFYRALKKYGKENFEWSIIDEVSCRTKESLLKCLKTLEIKYIEQFDSFTNGYNSTPGGDSFSDNSIPVKVYSDTGQFIRQFDSRREAAKYYNISEDCISAGCQRRQRFSYINEKRIIFRNKEDDVTENDLYELKQAIHNPKCKVKAIDSVTMETIKVFDTIKEGAKFFGLKSASPICELLNGNPRRKTAGRYNNHKIIWEKVIE